MSLGEASLLSTTAPGILKLTAFRAHRVPLGAGCLWGHEPMGQCGRPLWGWGMAPTARSSARGLLLSSPNSPPGPEEGGRPDAYAHPYTAQRPLPRIPNALHTPAALRALPSQWTCSPTPWTLPRVVSVHHASLLPITSMSLTQVVAPSFSPLSLRALSHYPVNCCYLRFPEGRAWVSPVPATSAFSSEPDLDGTSGKSGCWMQT